MVQYRVLLHVKLQHMYNYKRQQDARAKHAMNIFENYPMPLMIVGYYSFKL